MKKMSYEIDMCHGPLLGKILIFAIPLMLSSILQLLFNAADIVVVGHYVGSQALAAVGSTGALINLLINVFIGFSVGVNVLVARYYGAQDEQNISDTVHTAIMTSLLSSLFLVVVGISASKPLLVLMGTPEDVLDQASLYMKIYFAGMPVIMLYNFGSAILRAIGDTKRPLYFLLLAGIINVILNLFFVIVLHMGVEGVALATVISQIVSCFLVVRSLMRMPGALRLHPKQIKLHKSKFFEIVRIGLPAGMQGAIFSVSNVLIQSSVNSFGSIAMAGNTASSNIEGFIYVAMNAFYQSNLSFTSQNFGAKQFKRINRVLGICLACVTVVGLGTGLLAITFSDALLHIYSSDPEVISYASLRIVIICSSYFLCGIMDTLVGSMRGLGYSVLPMIVSLTGACGFRIVWIFTVFALDRSLPVLYYSYPVSWAITATAHLICFLIIRRKYPKTDC